MSKKKNTQNKVVTPKTEATVVNKEGFDAKVRQFEAVSMSRYMTTLEMTKFAKEQFEGLEVKMTEVNHNQIFFEVDGTRIPSEGCLTVNRQ